jgi:hypothetical protein
MQQAVLSCPAVVDAGIARREFGADCRARQQTVFKTGRAVQRMTALSRRANICIESHATQVRGASRKYAIVFRFDAHDDTTRWFLARCVD